MQKRNGTCPALCPWQQPHRGSTRCRPLTSSFPLLRPATMRFPCRSRLQTELSKSPPQEGSGDDLSKAVKDSSPRLLLRLLQPPSSLPQPRERDPGWPCGAGGPVKLMQLEVLCSSYTLPTRLLKS